MPDSATATASPAVDQLAYYWGALDDATKLIFNQLYSEAPDLVLRVMSRGQLQPDPAHTSLDDVIANADPDVGFNQARVSVHEVTVTPEYPQPNEKFTVTWKRSVQGEIPNHSDAVQIVSVDGTVVDQRPVAQGAAAHGASDEHTMEFAGGLPLGEYTVNVWVNLEGGDGTGVPTAQGLRGQGVALLYVGNTAGAQTAQQLPAAGAALGAVGDAAFAAGEIHEFDQALPLPDRLDEQFRAGLRNAAQQLMQIESLAGGFQAELTRINDQLQFPINWNPEREEGSVGALQQRLQGMAQMNAAQNPGDLAMALIQVVGDLY